MLNETSASRPWHPERCFGLFWSLFDESVIEVHATLEPLVVGVNIPAALIPWSPPMRSPFPIPEGFNLWTIGPLAYSLPSLLLTHNRAVFFQAVKPLWKRRFVREQHPPHWRDDLLVRLLAAVPVTAAHVVHRHHWPTLARVLWHPERCLSFFLI